MLWEQAAKITSDNEILEKIYNNQLLFKATLDLSYQAYTSADKAFKALTDGKIIMYLSDLGLFYVLSMVEYSSFGRVMHDRFLIEEDMRGVDIKPLVDQLNKQIYQIVVSSDTQKFVFGYTDPALKDTLVAAAVKHFRAKATSTKSQIAVNINCSNGQLREKYAEFCEALRRTHGEDIVGCISEIREFGDAINHTYRAYEVENAINTTEMAYLVDLLKNVGHNAPINITIQKADVVNNIVNNVNNYNYRIDPKTEALGWIDHNPPQPSETRSDYYIRYTNAVDAPLPTKLFGNYIKSRGYKIKHCGRNVYCWQRK